MPFHALAGYDPRFGDAEEVAALFLRFAARRAEAGQLGAAVSLVAEALRGLDCDEARRLLLPLWVEVALFDRTPRSLNRILCETTRFSAWAPDVARLEELVVAAMAVMAGSERALSMVDALSPVGEPRLERARLDLRVTAARRMAQDKAAALLEEASRFAEALGTPEARAAVLGFTGRFRYQEGRFEEAAALAERAAASERWVSPRVIALFHAGAAWMEAFRLDSAFSCADEARGLAREARHVYYEAKCEWLLRTIGYRRGTLRDADLSLVDAVAEVGVPISRRSSARRRPLCFFAPRTNPARRASPSARGASGRA